MSVDGKRLTYRLILRQPSPLVFNYSLTAPSAVHHGTVLLCAQRRFEWHQ